MIHEHLTKMNKLNSAPDQSGAMGLVWSAAPLGRQWMNNRAPGRQWMNSRAPGGAA